MQEDSSVGLRMRQEREMNLWGGGVTPWDPWLMQYFLISSAQRNEVAMVVKEEFQEDQWALKQVWEITWRPGSRPSKKKYFGRVLEMIDL